MLKLLSITLSRSSSLLAGGSYNILPEVLERLLPLLASTHLADLHAETAVVVCRILSRLYVTAPGLLAALARGTQALIEGEGGGGRRARGVIDSVASVALLSGCHQLSAPPTHPKTHSLPHSLQQMLSTWRAC